ncbi:MAG: type II toxin-antitoxin system RelE/ParE family toxin [Devosia sp.]
MKVHFSRRSRRDLAEIGDYIAKDSPRQAYRLVSRLEDYCAGLAEKSRRFPVVRERSGAELRRAVSGSYSIFYVVQLDTVSIVRILHSASDFEKLFGADD